MTLGLNLTEHKMKYFMRIIKATLFIFTITAFYGNANSMSKDKESIFFHENPNLTPLELYYYYNSVMNDKSADYWLNEAIKNGDINAKLQWLHNINIKKSYKESKEKINTIIQDIESSENKDLLASAYTVYAEFQLHENKNGRLFSQYMLRAFILNPEFIPTHVADYLLNSEKYYLADLVATIAQDHIIKESYSYRNLDKVKEICHTHLSKNDYIKIKADIDKILRLKESRQFHNCLSVTNDYHIIIPPKCNSRKNNQEVRDLD